MTMASIETTQIAGTCRRLPVRRPTAGFTLVELLVAIVILLILMSMIGVIVGQSVSIKETTENRLEDFVGGLTAARALKLDLQNMQHYADPTLPTPADSKFIYWIGTTSIAGVPNQSIVYVQTAADTFDRRHGDSAYVRWFIRSGILYREVRLDPLAFADLSTATEVDLRPFEVLRGVAWTVTNQIEITASPPNNILTNTVVFDASVYPTMSVWNRVERLGEDVNLLEPDEKPRSIQFQFNIARPAREDHVAQGS